MKKIHVILRGTVIDEKSQESTEDYDEWDCLGGVQITFDGKTAVSNALGDFRISKIIRVQVAATPKLLDLTFAKENYGNRVIKVPIIRDADAVLQNNRFLVKMILVSP